MQATLVVWTAELTYIMIGWSVVTVYTVGIRDGSRLRLFSGIAVVLFRCRESTEISIWRLQSEYCVRLANTHTYPHTQLHTYFTPADGWHRESSHSCALHSRISDLKMNAPKSWTSVCYFREVHGLT